jgi:hypothetical protein
LLARREKNGKRETSEKTKRGVLNFRRRAGKMWQFIKENYVREPYTLIEIPEGPSPADICEQLQRPSVYHPWVGDHSQRTDAGWKAAEAIKVQY